MRMSWLKRLFGFTLRKARRAAARGEYERAALLYVEADEPAEAARVLMTFAQRSSDPGVRRSRLWDALHWAKRGTKERNEIGALIGLSILDQARGRASHNREQTAELERGLKQLEEAQRWADAAAGWELLGQSRQVARCLEQGGEIERLEEVLDAVQARTDDKREVREAFRAYEGAYKVGARVEAREILERLDRGDQTPSEVARTLREIRKEWIGTGEVRLRIADELFCFVGRLPLTLGRTESDFVLRGTSVSRRHAEVDRRGEKWLVRDLGSRNGTLVEGIPIAAEAVMKGPSTIGLGDDVDVEVSLSEGGLVLRVQRGLDKGMRCIAGAEAIRLPGVGAILDFVEGVPRLSLAPKGPRTMSLNDAVSTGPIELLKRDRVEIGGVVLVVEA